MSYTISPIATTSLPYSPSGSDLSSALGGAHSQDKTAPGHGDTFKATSTTKSPVAYGIEKVTKVTSVPPPPRTDTVKLSVSDEVRRLRQQGEGPTQIATALHLSTKEVQDDLYVVTNFPQLLANAAQSQPVPAQSAGTAATTGAPTVTAPK